MHSRLTDEDLPRFEEQFLQYLRTNVIRDIASFQARLGAQEQQIRERIDVINTSLAGIDYNPGRYIGLEPPPRRTRRSASSSTTCAPAPASTLERRRRATYSEEKFLQVKALLDRFKRPHGHNRARQGVDRPGHRRAQLVRLLRQRTQSARTTPSTSTTPTPAASPAGRRRNSPTPSWPLASPTSSGIDRAATKPKTFRFVIIDEAFGRGSTSSAHFALDLFQRLGLQLLVVTPLQKIHVIEPHVARVGYVDRPDKTRSRLNNLTIEEFRAHKQAAAQQANQPPKEQA